MLNLMKVFMLEHGQQSTTTSETDVFREASVSTALATLIKPLTQDVHKITDTEKGSEIEIMPHSTISTVNLEETGKRSLGEQVPFFQFYTDFLALYEAISFSHPIFAQLLLPPLAMSYPIDYRRLVWVENPSSLRSIRTFLQDVPLEHGTRSVYFEPKETDFDVLAAYTRALIRGWISREKNEFLFAISIHHLASLLWKDEAEERNSPRVTLLIAILSSANQVVLQSLLEYDMTGHGQLDKVVSANEKMLRRDIVGRLAGTEGSRKVERL